MTSVYMGWCEQLWGHGKVEGKKTKEWGTPSVTLKGPRIFQSYLGKKNKQAEVIITQLQDLLQSYDNLDGIVLA